MKNSWLVWIFIVGVIVTVFIAFNYQSGDKLIPLGEIFPTEEKYSAQDVEYEYVDTVVKEEAPSADEVIVEEVMEQKAASTPVKEKEAVVVAPAVPSEPVEVKINFDGIPFTIQVASFKQKDRAEKTLFEVKEKGYNDSFIGAVDLGEKGVWYRVYVGKYSTKDEAQASLDKLKNDYGAAFVIAPKK